MTENYCNLSFWLDSVPNSVEPRPSLATAINADVAIIGAGYTGMWTAYYLKKNDPGLNVVIVESEIAGFGASGRNGGWCEAYLSGIDHWLGNPESRDAGINLQRQMFDCVKEVGRVSEQEGIDCHFEQSGALEVAVNSMQKQRLREELEHAHGLGFNDEDYQWMDAGEISGTIAMQGAQAAIHMKHAAAVHPARLARGLAETLQSMGVSIYEQSTVIGIGVDRVETEHGSVKASSIIMATEGYSNSATKPTNHLIPLHSMMVATEPLSASQLDEIRLQKRFCFSSIHSCLP